MKSTAVTLLAGIALAESALLSRRLQTPKRNHP